MHLAAVMMLAATSMFSFTSCDEETTETFILSVYVATDQWEVIQAKDSKQADYVEWADYKDFSSWTGSKTEPLKTTFRFDPNSKEITAEGYYADCNGATWEIKGTLMTISKNNRVLYEMTLNPLTSTKEMEVELLDKNLNIITYLKMKRVKIEEEAK
jgi:hypothetical protein